LFPDRHLSASTAWYRDKSRRATTPAPTGEQSRSNPDSRQARPATWTGNLTILETTPRKKKENALGHRPILATHPWRDGLGPGRAPERADRHPRGGTVSSGRRPELRGQTRSSMRADPAERQERCRSWLGSRRPSAAPTNGAARLRSSSSSPWTIPGGKMLPGRHPGLGHLPGDPWTRRSPTAGPGVNRDPCGRPGRQPRRAPVPGLPRPARHERSSSAPGRTVGPPSRPEPARPGA